MAEAETDGQNEIAAIRATIIRMVSIDRKISLICARLIGRAKALRILTLRSNAPRPYCSAWRDCIGRVLSSSSFGNLPCDKFAPRVALGEVSAHDASLSRGRLNTGKFAALKLFCALSMERVQRCSPTATKYIRPTQAIRQTGIEPWFYKTFWHHDARPAGMR